MRFRRSELLLNVFFLYSAGAVFLFPGPFERRILVVTLNAALIAWSFLLAYAHRGRGFLFLDVVRDWWPAPLLLVAFEETAWLCVVNHPGKAELALGRWDHWALVGSGLKALLDAGTPVIPAGLELAYLLVLFSPLWMLLLMHARPGRERLDDAWTILLIATLSALVIRPWLSMEPPRSVFAGELLPPDTLFRHWNIFVLAHAEVRAGVFPSPHITMGVSSSLAVLLLRPGRKLAGWLLLAVSGLAGVGAVYGRYHYTADVVAAILVSAVAAGVGWVLTRANR